jgi:hypothetical protein
LISVSTDRSIEHGDTAIKMGKTEDGEKKKLTKEEKEVRCGPPCLSPPAQF